MQLVRAALVLATCIGSQPNIAMANSDLDACSKIVDDVARLACFDSHFVEKTTQTTKGAWKVDTEVSRIDDKTNVFMRLESDDLIRGRFSGAGPMVLNIMCRENTTDLSIYFNGLHMSDYQYGTVTYRLDKDKAKQKRMVESTSNEHLGLWGGGNSIPFIKAMFGKSQLLIEATPYGENSVAASFNISGIGEAIEPLRKACHW